MSPGAFHQILVSYLLAGALTVLILATTFVLLRRDAKAHADLFEPSETERAAEDAGG